MNEISDLPRSSAASMRSDISKREGILDAATRVFLARGFEDTTMDLVAKEASVARRTVYNQFESKEALFIASVERVWRGFPVVEITADQSTLSDPAAGLKRIGDAVVNFWEPPIAVSFLRMVISEGTRFPDLPTTFFQAGKAPAMRALVEYLRTLNANHVLLVEDAELAASQFLGLLNEPLLWLRVIGIGDAPSKERQEKVVAEGVNMFLSRYGEKKTLPATS